MIVLAGEGGEMDTVAEPEPEAVPENVENGTKIFLWVMHFCSIY